jgi:hypothetical protein
MELLLILKLANKGLVSGVNTTYNGKKIVADEQSYKAVRRLAVPCAVNCLRIVENVLLKV